MKLPLVGDTKPVETIMRGRTINLTWHHDPDLKIPAKYRKACRYDAFLPERLVESPLSISAEAAGLAAEAEGAIRSLNATAKPALAPLARLLLRTESIASSKVEGLQLDVRTLARAESRMETGGRISPEASEIMANIGAMELAIEQAASAKAIESKHIRGIHQKLMQRSPTPQFGGKLRTVQNWIGGNDFNPCGADFVPPPPDEVQKLIEDLCGYINDETLPPIVQAAFTHAQFETIHPFEDGNGRTGRALIHVVLRRRQVAPEYVPPISVVLAADRDRYIQGLVDYRLDRTDAWIENFGSAALRSAQLASDYIDAVQELSARWRGLLAARKDSPRAGAAAWVIIDQLPGHPVITAPVAAAATGRSKPQIYQGLSQLEAAGVLVPLSKGQRNRSWEAAGLLDLLVGLEAAELPQRSRGASR